MNLPRRAAAVLLAWACASGASGASAQVASALPAASSTSTGPAFLGGLLTQSRVLYPLQVGVWMAASEQRPLRQEDGVVVRYVDNRRQRWIDVAFYPVPARGEAAMAMIAAGEREGLDAAARQAGEMVEPGVLERFRLQAGAADAADAADGADPADVQAWRMELRYPQRGRVAALMLFERDLYVVRALAQAGETASSPESLSGQLQAFMQSMARRLRIVSTGACWLPAHTEVVATLPQAGTGGVLTGYRDRSGGLVAVALRDRVLVAREQAARGGELSAALSANVYPGCVAPEAIEPEVPPDLREIRIEYHVPGRAGPSGGPHLGRPRPPQVAAG